MSAIRPPIQFNDLSDDGEAEELVGDDLRELIELTYRDASHLADSYGRLLTSLQVSVTCLFPEMQLMLTSPVLSIYQIKSTEATELTVSHLAEVEQSVASVAEVYTSPVFPPVRGSGEMAICTFFPGG